MFPIRSCSKMSQSLTPFRIKNLNEIYDPFFELPSDCDRNYYFEFVDLLWAVIS